MKLGISSRIVSSQPLQVIRTVTMFTPQSPFVSKLCDAGSGVVMKSNSDSGALAPPFFVGILTLEDFSMLRVVNL